MLLTISIIPKCFNP